MTYILVFVASLQFYNADTVPIVIGEFGSIEACTKAGVRINAVDRVRGTALCLSKYS